MNRRHFIRRMTLTAAGLWVPNVLGQRVRCLGGGQPWAATATAFNGSSYLYRAAFTGAAASKSGTLSLWFKCLLNGVAQNFLVMGPNTSTRQFIGKDAYNRLWFKFQNSAYTTAYGITTSGATFTDSLWHHLYISFDAAGAIASNYAFYIDGVAATGTLILNDVSVVWNEVNVGIGARYDGATPLTGSLAEIVLYPGSGFRAPAVYLSKFRSGSGRPVDLGANGSLPWGQTPLYYGHGSLLSDTSGNNQAFTYVGPPTLDTSTVSRS